MLSRLKDWFLTHQVKLASGLGLLSVAIIFMLDYRGPVALAVFIFSIASIFVGGRIFQHETSENWLSISYGGLLRNVVGSILMLFGWVTLLRGLVAIAIAVILLRVS